MDGMGCMRNPSTPIWLFGAGAQAKQPPPAAKTANQKAPPLCCLDAGRILRPKGRTQSVHAPQRGNLGEPLPGRLATLPVSSNAQSSASIIQHRPPSSSSPPGRTQGTQATDGERHGEGDEILVATLPQHVLASETAGRRPTGCS